jgi:hypothetical protein
MNALSQSQQLAFAFLLCGPILMTICWIAFFVIDGRNQMGRE